MSLQFIRDSLETSEKQEIEAKANQFVLINNNNKEK
jgi:hypothetical protein